MDSTKTRITADNQSRIVMPTDTAAFGVSACGRIDARWTTHVPALVKGATGAPSWSPPLC